MGPNDANVGLGCQINPISIQTHKVLSWCKQRNVLVAQLNIAHLTDHETWVLVEYIDCPKVFYLCKVTSFLEKYWSGVTRQAVCAFSSNMRLNRNTSRKLLCGPHTLGDIVLTHRFVKQGADSTYHLLTHLWWNKEVDPLIKCVLSQLQLLSVHRWHALCWQPT